MRKVLLGMLFFVFMTGCVQYRVQAISYEDEFEVSIAVIEKYDMAFELLECINQERQSLGLQPLVMDRELMEAAFIRAAEVNVLNSHWRPNGTRGTIEMGVEAVYENINSYALSAKSICESWMTSQEGHRIPIEDKECKSIGIGIVNHAAVAEFAYAESDAVDISGTYNRIRDIQFRMSLCRFSVNKESSLEYGSKGKLMLISTIENQGIPTEIGEEQFYISSNSPDVVNILDDGSLYGAGTGTAEINVALKEQPVIYINTSLTVEQLDLSIQTNAEFIYEQNHIYSGNAIEPMVTVRDKYNKILQAGKDYSLTYKDNVTSGTAWIEVKGQGNYCGTRYLSFTIQDTAVTEEENTTEQEDPDMETEGKTFLANFDYVIPTVTLSQECYWYDGEAKTPAVNVSVKGEVLQEGIDYIVSYENNVNPGYAIVKVAGINRCSGEYRVTFWIEEVVQEERGTEVEKEADSSVGFEVAVEGTVNDRSSDSTFATEVPVTETDTSINHSDGMIVPETSLIETVGVINSSEKAPVQETSSKGTIKISSRSEKQIQSKNTVKVSYSKLVETSRMNNSIKQVKEVTVKQPKIKRVKSVKRKQVTVYWNNDKSVTGYQIRIARNKKMTVGRKTIKVSSKRSVYTVKKLSSKKTYYVKIRAYKKVNGKTYYSRWSAIKKVRVK